ncbi:CpsD/CapB family tyrosine-protein kinase [Sporolactobacillus pectinivorans]|uniref:CpsD/CapB family tyrosine-protein kinase n=1 Tax=Sporolactobacillus pectinivorans TaxID=1591408 RepID=UPI000C257273|nr:CpsD/CapB family tyrosine-protein kinase [Sporolactobacillus pectinivorans]
MRKLNRGKKFGKPLNLIIRMKKRSLFAEQYRSIRTSLESFEKKGVLKSIIVTSSRSGEGKSTTAANLAVVMAQKGKKVLLIDADMRRPVLHIVFQKTNNVGLSSVLRNNRELFNVIQKTEVNNLSVLPSGPEVSDPADLLSSLEMNAIIERALGLYDLVILDSPPVLEVADTRVIANCCDGVLFVIKSRTTESDIAMMAAENLSEAGARILGVVLNDAHASKKYGNILMP